LKDLTAKKDENTHENREVLLSTMNYCCFLDIKESDMSKHSFVADSGASCHMVKDKNLLTNFIPEAGKVKVGDSRLTPSYGYGIYRGIHTN
jgi:hypothetical protein